MVAPNGARLQKADHPAIPITQDEVVACAAACFAAGADGIHAHIRDEDGQHSLDIDRYAALLTALRAAVPEMAIQITTEAVGRYAPAQQMDVALNAGADMVSVAIREISGAEKERAAQFFAECARAGIAVQHLLFDLDDCRMLEDTIGAENLRRPDLQLLYVLGRYAPSNAVGPEGLDVFLDWQRSHDLTPDWAVCAFGNQETDCLLAAAAAGGKCRVGFENSRTLSNGQIATDNPEKVRDLLALLP